MITELNIARVNAILKNAIEQGRELTVAEMVLCERLTREAENDN